MNCDEIKIENANGLSGEVCMHRNALL